jgi:transcription-repair coupling factor (superfamily II helicase)
VSKKQLDDRSVVLSVGGVIDADQTVQQLRTLGFHEVDYVYEPGQFALRGSILDI